MADAADKTREMFLEHVLKNDLYKKSRPANWKPWIDGVVTFSPDANRYPTDEELHEMARQMSERYLGGTYLMSAVHRDEKTAHVHWMAYNVGRDDKGLPITRETLSGMQTWAADWLKQRGYQFDRGAENLANGEPRAKHQSVRESHIIEAAKLAKEREELTADIEARQNGKTRLEEDLLQLRTEAQDMKSSMQTMEEAMQETSLAVGIYEHALQEQKRKGRPPVRVSDAGLQRAREYAKSRAGQSRGMALVQRLLQRQDAMELLGGLMILSPALLTTLVVAAVGVAMYRAQNRTVGAAPTPPAEKEKYQGEGLEAMITEMMSQVQEALRAVEGLNRRMDEMEKRMDTERRENDASPVVMRVREDAWTAEMRENGCVYVRQGETIVGEDRMELNPRPTRDEAGRALTRILRHHRQREVPGTPAVPTPAGDTLMAQEIQR